MLMKIYLSRHGLASAAVTGPGTIRDFFQWWLAALQVVGRRTAVATEQLSTLLADTAELHVLVFLVNILDLGAICLAVRAAPLAFGSLVQLRVETDQVISTRTRVTQNDFACKERHGEFFVKQQLNVLFPPPCWQTSQYS